MVVQMCNEHRNEKVSSDQEYEAGNSVEYNRIYYKVIYLQEDWIRKIGSEQKRQPTNSVQIILC